MKGSRPHQRYYTPGSGSLRKTNNSIEESESDTNIVVNHRDNRNQSHVDTKFGSGGNRPSNACNNTDHMMDKFDELSIKDAPRRSRKPDLEIYVPRMVAQNKKPEQENGAQRSYNTRNNFSQEKEIIGDNDRNSYGHPNGNEKRFESNSNDRFSSNKPKRYSTNRRRGSEQREYNDDWGDRNNHPRQMRQGSEPRNMDNSIRESNNWPRTRDTRSMEHSGHHNSMSGSNYGDKPYPSKPPSGRRNSTNNPDRVNEIPPRFRRKMEEAKLKNANMQEEAWDGSSLTFQNTSSHHSGYSSMDNYQSGPGSYATLPNSHQQNQSMSGLNYGFSTLPARSRGRGRLKYDSTDYGSIGRPADLRSPGPSRPSTPQSVTGSYKDDNYGRPSSRPHTPSYGRRNDYNRNNDDHHYPSSRHSSQERYRRTNYRDNNYQNRQPEESFSHRRNDDRHSAHGREDYHQNRGDSRNNRRRNEHRDRRGRGDYRRDDYRTQNVQEDRYSEASASRDISPAMSSVSSQWESVPPCSEAPMSPTPKEAVVSSLKQDKTREMVFDWSEDVEKQEQETFSDAPSRSSSIVSLVENSANQTSPQTNGNSLRKSKSKSKRRDKRRRRSRSNSMREISNDRFNAQQPETFDNFKVPTEPARRRPSRDSSFDRFSRSSKNLSRDCSFDRMRKSSTSECENWRDEIRVRQEQGKDMDVRRSRNNSGTSDLGRTRRDSEDTQGKRVSCDLSDIDVKKAGVLVIPQGNSQDNVPVSSPPRLDNPRYSDARKQGNQQTKSLFDPNNPDKPIIIKSPNSRVSQGIPENKETTQPSAVYDMYGNICPAWYIEGSEENQMSHFPNMITDVKRADQEIQYAIHSGIFLKNWSAVETFRQFLKESLQYFLWKDLKFSQACNIEQHFWKLLYYNIIERIRKASQDDENNKDHYKQFVLFLVDEGTQYFEGLLKLLEDTHQFQLSDFLGGNQSVPQKGLGYVGLALISAQKILIFLGDLARYKEQINETMNFGKCRQWYIKAHEINPKNGRPYKQLAHLAVCARRKLDAVYYYMRSLMSSNPIYSSREKLTSLFYENSRKYEQGEKKRREERQEKARQYMKEKESDSKPKSLRKETWIRPDGGQRVHRTTQAVQKMEDSEEENLLLLSSVEVNKRFVISYLHVHGKLITKIGMDSFQEAAQQMLKEFRALLQHSPLPIPSNRLLQLLALNMFAIESNQLKDPEQRLSGYRSEFQECALVVSLQMFNLILERCVSLLEEHLAAKPEKLNEVSMDTQVLLPSIKIWCDWMLCHSSVWNPPPSTQDFRVGAPVDPWTRLAMLINLLRQLDQSPASVFEEEQKEGYELLRLPEDNALSGFTPLMLKVDEPTYVPKNLDVESAQFVLRLNKLLFFGTEFLCGLEPPVLKLEIDNDFTEYISVVSNANSRDSPQSVEEMNDQEVLVESYSDSESKIVNMGDEDTSSEVRDLLTRKVELERWHKKHQLHMERVEKILAQSIISVHIEVLPKYLVPDTNCFIDHLERINTIIKAPNSPYTIMVPIVVLGELEGLGRGGITPVPGTLYKPDPEHTKKVGEAARNALAMLKKRHHNIKCVTTNGSVLNSTAFTTEEDSSNSAKNDDRILNTCLNLSKLHEKPMESKEGEPRQIFREVVLLTDDRNLRVKAHSTDVPVRELPDFMKWAGLG